MDKGCLGELEDWSEAELRERARRQILLGLEIDLECNKWG